MSEHLIYMTASSETEAEAICTELVQQRLAACANILGRTKSFFWWEGEVQSDSEIAFILKTSGKNLGALIDAAKKLHSYDCPCVVAVEIANGNLDFLNWISKETS